MAKVKLSPFIQERSGTLNGLVFKRPSQGVIIGSKKPDMSKVVWSKAPRRAKRLKRRSRDLAIFDYFQGKNLLLNKSLGDRKSPPSGK